MAERKGTERKVMDGFTPMFASVVVDDVELEPASRKLVGVKVTLPKAGNTGQRDKDQNNLGQNDKGKVEFDRPLEVDLAGAGAGAMIGFFLTREAEDWQLLVRTHNGQVPGQQVSVGEIAGLDVPDSGPPV